MSASDVANDSQIFSLKALGEIVNETMTYWFPIALNLSCINLDKVHKTILSLSIIFCQKSNRR